MQTKDTLQALQTRLSGRIDASGQARAEAPHWLAVKVAGVSLLLPLSQAGEIFPWVEPLRVPYVKDWFLGVTNLRGMVYGVVSLTKYLGLEASMIKTGSTDALVQQHERRLIGFHLAYDINTVLLVDQLVGLKGQHQMTALEAQNQYADEAGITWHQIDLGLLAVDPSFVHIAAA